MGGGESCFGGADSVFRFELLRIVSTVVLGIPVLGPIERFDDGCI